MHFIWIISGVLCLVLLVATVAVVAPEVVAPFISERWLRKFFYWRH